MKLKHAFMLAASAFLSAAAFFGCNSDGNSGSADAPAKAAAKTKPLVVYCPGPRRTTPRSWRKCSSRRRARTSP